ncbi:MAG: cell division protein FtsZ [Bacteroidales bacterium]|nr:cell division protein FtsZ [Bacteroidales bacterium]
MIKFDLPKEQSSIIKVLGIGGGGGNAVNHMYHQGIKDVDFLICNTDAQALEDSPVPTKIQLGGALTEGRGAGSIPDVGREAVLENVEDIGAALEKNTKMLFITAGMGGGTGTGGAPVVAAKAREMDILTVGIVTVPFSFEGRKRRQQAEEGIREMQENVDSLLIVSNDKLRELYGNLKLSEAFSKADDILATAAKGISELITVTGHINVDFEDVKTVMKNSGVAIMGMGVSGGEDRAIKAIEMALSSPLLNDNHIRGAEDILLYIASGEDEIQMDEVSEITDYIQDESGATAEIIWGNGVDETLGDKIAVTVVATGFQSNGVDATAPGEQKEPVVHKLTEEQKNKENQPAGQTESSENEFELYTRENRPESKEETESSNNEPDEFGFRLHTKASKSSEEKKAESAVSDYNQKDETPQEEKESFKTVKKINEPAPNFDSEERVKKLRELSMKIKTQEGLQEAENVPAFVRRKVQLKHTRPSSESEISRFTLTDEDEDMDVQKGNSYLHDNVD